MSRFLIVKLPEDRSDDEIKKLMIENGLGHHKISAEVNELLSYVQVADGGLPGPWLLRSTVVLQPPAETTRGSSTTPENAAAVKEEEPDETMDRSPQETTSQPLHFGIGSYYVPNNPTCPGQLRLGDQNVPRRSIMTGMLEGEQRGGSGSLLSRQDLPNLKRAYSEGGDDSQAPPPHLQPRPSFFNGNNDVALAGSQVSAPSDNNRIVRHESVQPAPAKPPGHDFCCSTCGKSFPTNDALTEHGESRHQCQICGKMLKSVNNHAQHMASQHPQGRRNQCEICRRYFSYPEALTNHMRQHIGPFTCIVCGQILPSEQLLYKHRKEHTKDHFCDKCFMIFANSYLKNSHHCNIPRSRRSL